MRNEMNKTGIYIAYPVTCTSKSIYRGYKTKVNKKHTKTGIATDSFSTRKKDYCSTFNDEVEFIPVAVVSNLAALRNIEKSVLSNIKKEFPTVGHARKWFDTDDRNRIIDIITQTLSKSGRPFRILCRRECT